jgi:hypothetical protein
MDKRTWMLVGGIAAVAVAIALYLRHKNSSESSDSQSQLPAEKAEANYSVPPNIGMSVDNTGGANFPQGESGFTYTTAQAQALPSNGDGS